MFSTDGASFRLAARDAARALARRPTGRRMAVHHGRVLHLSEVATLTRAAAGDSTSVRVVGTLVEFDLTTGGAVIQHCEARLAVDASLLSGVSYQLGVLLECIGELYWPDVAEDSPDDSLPAKPILRARIARDASGRNMALYERAMGSLREFCAQEPS